jgi:hypothetical protein
MAGKTYIKTSADTWARIKKIYIKTGGQTWTAVRKAYIKTGTGTWRKIYDTASNKPFLRNGDFPRIRLNSFRSAGYVEAPPVQMMGPSTGSANGWPLGAIGTYLYGANADDLSNYVSGNGSSISYTYNWYYNLTGNQNDDQEWTGAVNSGSDRDLFQNNSTYLGAGDGEYFDRNFLTFKVNATNSAGTLSASSPQVYIVRQRPTGTVTMIDEGTASINSTMSATFTYSSNWHNKTDTAESYVEWFAVDNLSDTLTTSNRVQIEYLNTFSTSGTTTKSATTFHNPTLSNKFYVVRTTLNNSNTLPAKYLGSVISVIGFTPNSAFTAQASKTVKTVSANGAFSLSNPTKTGYFYEVSNSTWRRFVSVDIGQSSGADRYEVQIEGQYVGAAGVYSFSSASWVVLRTFLQSPYTMESSRIGGTLTMASASMPEYLNYRLTARSLNGTSTNGAAYSNAGTSTSFVYVTAPAVAPATPSISNIQTATDFQGSYVTFNNSLSSNGSNGISYYTYSIDNGSSFQQPSGSSSIGSTSGKIYVTPGAPINLRIRATNADGATSSSSNLLSITAASIPGAPTSIVVKSFTSKQGTIFFTSGSNTQSVQASLEFDTFANYDFVDGYVNVASNTAAKVQLNGALSATQTYNSVLIPYSGTNKTGNQGALTYGSTKVLNGSDAMNVSVGTITRPSDRTISLTWTLTAGAPTHYIARLYNYTAGTLISTKTITAPTTSVSFTSADGVAYSTIYYISIQPQYRYTSSVTYEDFIYTSSNINSGANVTPPTSTSISSMSRLSDTSVRAIIASSGGSGPYYQLYWSTGTSAPVTPGFDAASTTSTVTEDFSPSSGFTYYFYIRSSSENLGNTTTGSSATAGTYSDYGPTTGAASYAFAQPSGTVSVSPSSGTAGTTQYTATPSITSSPASSISYQWRFREGASTWLAISGATSSTYTPPSNYVSLYGGALRCDIVANNGVGTQLVTNSSSVTVNVPVSVPVNSTVPTLTGNLTVGSVLTFGVGTWTNTPTSYDLRLYRGTANVNTSETLAKNAGNTTSSTYTITQADLDSGQLYFRAFATATNAGGTSNSGTFTAGQERGPITAALAVPSNTSQPTLTGNLSVGSTLTFGVGSWSGSPTSYNLRLYRGTQFVSSSETLASNAGNATSGTYVITQADFNSTQKYFRAFATATNAAGTSNGGTFTAGQEVGPITAAPATPAPVLVSIAGNNSLTYGGTFSWSYSNSPTAYSILVQGPNGTVYTTNNAYTYTGTSFRPGYDGNIAPPPFPSGNYTVYVSARNSGGDSVVSSQTTFMS